jgi:centrosomal protein CEP41
MEVNNISKLQRAIMQVELQSNQMMVKRRGELFKRISSANLVKLIKSVAVSDVSEETKIAPEDSASQASRFSVFTLDGEVKTHEDFVLLDLRDPEEYVATHIRYALSFPAPNVTRDRILPEMFRIKNQPGKLIIVYAQDERPGVENAQKLAQRGFENVFLVTGGLEEFAKQYSQYLEGNHVRRVNPAQTFKGNESEISTNSSVSKRFAN